MNTHRAFHAARLDEPTAQQIYARAFNKPRTPRSPEYRAGVLSCLRWRERQRHDWLARNEGVLSDCKYAAGTAAFDAFFAGVEEGHALWREAVGTAAGASEALR